MFQQTSLLWQTLATNQLFLPSRSLLQNWSLSPSFITHTAFSVRPLQPSSKVPIHIFGTIKTVTARVLCLYQAANSADLQPASVGYSSNLSYHLSHRHLVYLLFGCIQSVNIALQCGAKSLISYWDLLNNCLQAWNLMPIVWI